MQPSQDTRCRTWLGKGGYGGGGMAFRGRTLDPLIASVAFAPLARNIHLVGTPDMIVDWLVRLRAPGVDGVQVKLYDFGPDLDRFARTVPPLMREAGLWAPEPAGLENNGSEG